MTEPAASTDDVWTVQKILQWTTDFLQSKGVESARLEAELLLAHARNCQRIHLYTDFEIPLTADQRVRMRDFVKRRAAREPLAYITGQREFYGRDFAVGKGVLVPRPETETLVDVCLENIPREVPMQIGEVGFGSGCVAITLAKQRPAVSIWASDISDAAFQFASTNIDKFSVGNQVTLIKGSGLTAFRATAPDRFHGIVSNPPYVRSDEMPGLSPEVRDHEPSEALVSGLDGLDLIRSLISDAPEFLLPQGWMALEVDPAQCEPVSQLFVDAGFEHPRIRRDLFGQDRIVEARLP